MIPSLLPLIIALENWFRFKSSILLFAYRLAILADFAKAFPIKMFQNLLTAKTVSPKKSIFPLSTWSQNDHTHNNDFADFLRIWKYEQLEKQMPYFSPTGDYVAYGYLLFYLPSKQKPVQGQ